MTLGEYVVGWVFLAGVFGISAITAEVLRRRCFGRLEALPAALAFAPLFFAALIAAHLLPGVLGLLDRGWVLASAAALAVLAAYVTRSASLIPTGEAAADQAAAERSPGSGSLVVPVAAAVAVAAWGLVLLWNRRSTLTGPPFSFDMLTFDLPMIARWIQSGSIWVSRDLVPLQAHAAYPQNGDVVCLAAILPWRSAFLVPLLGYPLWALGALAVHAIARHLGAARWSAVLLGTLFAATPLILLTAAVADVADGLMWAMFGIGVLFLLRHLRSAMTAELVLAGLALGLAFGSKWYGLTCVPIVVAIWLVASWRTRRPGRSIARDAALLTAVILLSGGFWLLRNVVEYGNPVFPHRIALGGLTLFGGPQDTYGRAFGFSVVHYLGDWGVWSSYLIPQYKSVLRLPGVVLLAGLAAVSAVGAWRSRSAMRSGDLPPATYVGLAAVLIVLAYLVTPQTALGPQGMPTLAGVNARYAAPGLLLGAAAIAWALSLLRGGLWLPAQILLAAAMADSFRRPLSVSGVRVAIVALAIVGAGHVTLRIARGRVAGERDWRAVRRVAIAGAAALALGLVGSGLALQRRFDSKALRGRDAAVDWVLVHDRDHSRIGMTGSWATDVAPVLAMFGPTFANHVRYVGRNDRGLVRHFTTYQAWIRAVRAAHLDLLLVGRQPQPLEPDLEARWAARAGFTPVASSPRFTLYRPQPG